MFTVWSPVMWAYTYYIFMGFDDLDNTSFLKGSFKCLIAAVSLSNGYYLGALLFFTIQRIWIVLVRCLFLKICSHIFLIFEGKFE